MHRSLKKILVGLGVVALAGSASVGVAAAAKPAPVDPSVQCTALGGVEVVNNSGNKVDRRCHADSVVETTDVSSEVTESVRLVSRTDQAGVPNAVTIEGDLVTVTTTTTVTTVTTANVYQWALGGGGKWVLLEDQSSVTTDEVTTVETAAAIDASSCTFTNNGGTRPCGDGHLGKLLAEGVAA